jgi:hypothetical protein
MTSMVFTFELGCPQSMATIEQLPSTIREPRTKMNWRQRFAFAQQTTIHRDVGCIGDKSRRIGAIEARRMRLGVCFGIDGAMVAILPV